MARTALVTGASAGIGREFARELASDGFDLVLVARRKERLEILRQELANEFGVTAHVCADDLADPAAPARVIAWTQREHIGIDMLVNNAGGGIAQTYRDAPWSAHAQLIQVQDPQRRIARCTLARRANQHALSRRQSVLDQIL
jgi:short-subunit dehydrogenase